MATNLFEQFFSKYVSCVSAICNSVTPVTQQGKLSIIFYEKNSNKQVKHVIIFLSATVLVLRSLNYKKCSFTEQSWKHTLVLANIITL